MNNQAAQTMPEPITASMCPSSDYAKGWNDCLAALTREAPTEGVGVPDGWKLVPAEPTREMVEAGVMFGNSPNKASIIYQNMIHAALNPPLPRDFHSDGVTRTSQEATPPAPQRLAQGEECINVTAAKALIAAVGPGYRVIYRKAFRWVDDKDNVLPNHYEMFGAESLAKDFGYDLVLDLGFAAIIRDALPPDALTHDEQSIEDDLRAYGVGFTMNGVRVDPSQVVVHQPPHHDRGEEESARAVVLRARRNGRATELARELLAREYEKEGCHGLAESMRAGQLTTHLDECSIRAITAALTEAKQQGPGEDEIVVNADVLASCVANACAYIDSNAGWSDYGVGREKVQESYRAMLAAPQVEAKRQTGEVPAGMMLIHKTDAECLVRDAERFIGENQGTAGGRLARKRVRAMIAAAAKPSGEE